MARLDTGWHANPKVLRAGAAGMALHAWSISYSDAARSDGFIPAHAWPSFLEKGVSVLVRLNLWHAVEDGYRLHDYDKYNRSRAEIEALQEDARRRQSRHRSRVTDPVTNGVSNGVTLARAGAPGPGPGNAESFGLLALPPTPYPLPNPNGAPFEPAARRAVPPPTADAALEVMYGPKPAEPERLPNGAQQCPICPEVFTGDYTAHIAARHKRREVPDDLSGRGRLPLPEAPPPEMEAEFAAMHARLAAIPEGQHDGH